MNNKKSPASADPKNKNDSINFSDLIAKEKERIQEFAEDHDDESSQELHDAEDGGW